MTNYEKYQALIKIQHQLQDWMARQPEDHFKKYGNKSINESVQLAKKLVSFAAMDVMAEGAQNLGLYDVQYNDNVGNSSDNSLGIQNIQ